MNSTEKRAIFLDFDGVLFDTVKEAYCISIIALGRFHRIVDIDLGSAHFHKFAHYRYLVGPAWNYFYLIRSIDKKIVGPEIDLENEFQQSLKNGEEKEHLSFEEKFFQARNHLRKTEYDHWLSIITPYRIVDDLRELLKGSPEKFFMVTTRDRESVVHLLRMNQLDIPEENIFAQKEYAAHNSKREIIQSLIRDRQIEKSMFIDDMEDHLRACKIIRNLFPLQAQWGYVNPDKKKDNRVCILEGIEKFIQGENVWA